MFIVKDINEQYDDLLQQLELNEKIIVDNKKIKELFSIIYNLDLNYIDIDSFVKKNIEFNSIEDYNERNKFFKEIEDRLYLFDEDLYTRRFVIQMKYNNNIFLSSCISLMQFIVRKNKLYMFIYIRSQNIENNFLYDNQTFLLCYNKCLQYLKKFDIQKAYININVISLHKIIKGD